MLRLAVTSVVFVAALSACPTPPSSTDAGADAGPVICPALARFVPPIDFGCATLGDTLVLAWDAGAGTTTSPLSGGPFSIDGGALAFAPNTLGDFTLDLPLFEGVCPVGTQHVSGTGVATVFSWEPASLDFGAAYPGASRRKTLTFRTCSFTPISLTNVATREGAASSQVFGVDGGAFVVPPAARTDAGLAEGTLTLDLAFTPLVLGPKQGQLTATTSFGANPALSVSLLGTGGGPRIDVQPTTVDFGIVTTPSTRAITISNIGTAPGTLFLGVDGMPPYWSLAPADCGVITVSPAYDPSVGIPPGSSLPFTIELAPAAAPRTCTLHVFSTDPGTPDVEVTITAS
ncbi:MAG: hypothetical protein U0228_06065 [Myxococcaceae bacterium]